MKIYIAGSMFSEAEIAARLKEEELIKQTIPDVEIYNPISAPFNTNKSALPSPQEIYKGDYKEIFDCDVLLADLGCFYDGGLMMEIGIAAALNETVRQDNPIFILGVLSDIRLSSANAYDIPSFGYNHMVLGGVLEWGAIRGSLKDAVSML